MRGDWEPTVATFHQLLDEFLKDLGPDT